MPKTRAQKEQTVQELTDKLIKAKSVVFADYQQAGSSSSKGMTMTMLSDLRNKLRDQDAEFIVTKNNLLKLAAKQANAALEDDLFEGPIATLFSYADEISPIKTLTKAFKDNQIGTVKAGILIGEIIDQSTINKLASLPSKDELRAKIVGSLGAPLYGIVGVLQANLGNLVYALDQIRISRGGV